MIGTAQRFALQLFAALLFVVFVSPAAQAQDDEVVRINSDLVVLNLSVSDKNAGWLGGLKASDFSLFEDNAPQLITDFQAEQTPFAAAILLDFSGSMEDRASLARSAAARFLGGLRDEDVAAVYRFDSKALTLQEFGHARDLAPVVYEERPDGRTALFDAIVLASKDLSQRNEKRRAIVVLSDGIDTSSKAGAAAALHAASAANVTIYAVNLSYSDGPRDPGAAQGSLPLKELATKSGGRFIGTPGGAALRNAFTEIASELGNQYTVTYRSSNRARDGKWRSILVRTAITGAQIRTRKGYYAPAN